MTNIKIVRRLAHGPYKEGAEPEVYDIYFDVGLFSPLIKRWKIDKSALTNNIKTITRKEAKNDKIAIRKRGN